MKNEQNRLVMKGAFEVGNLISRLNRLDVTVLKVSYGETSKPEVLIAADQDAETAFADYPKSLRRAPEPGLEICTCQVEGCLVTWVKPQLVTHQDKCQLREERSNGCY